MGFSPPRVLSGAGGLKPTLRFVVSLELVPGKKKPHGKEQTVGRKWSQQFDLVGVGLAGQLPATAERFVNGHYAAIQLDFGLRLSVFGGQAFAFGV